MVEANIIEPLADSKKSKARRNFNTSGCEARRNLAVLNTLLKPAVSTLEPATSEASVRIYIHDIYVKQLELGRSIFGFTFTLSNWNWVTASSPPLTCGNFVEVRSVAQILEDDIACKNNLLAQLC